LIERLKDLTINFLKNNFKLLAQRVNINLFGQEQKNKIEQRF
jgi:hypothetical protein